MLNPTQQRELQKLLKNKQSFIQKAIQEIQRGNKEEAITNVSLDAGFNIDIIKIIEGAK